MSVEANVRGFAEQVFSEQTSVEANGARPFHGAFFNDISLDTISAFRAKRINHLIILGSTKSSGGSRARASSRWPC